MKHIEEQLWPWIMNGFKGLTGMIRHYLDSGLAPTEDLHVKVKAVRDELNAILERIGEPKTP